MKLKSLALAAILMIGVAACQEEESSISNSIEFNDDIEQKLHKAGSLNFNQSNARVAGDIQSWMAMVNEALISENIALNHLRCNTVFAGKSMATFVPAHRMF